MRKGYSSDITWLIVGVITFILVAIAVWTILNTSAVVRSDFPGTSARIGSQILMQEFMSEDCTGAGIVGVLDRSKLDSNPSCFSDLSFSGYVRVEDETGSAWEFGELPEKSSLQSSFPVLIQDQSGKRIKGKIAYSFSYITDDLLLLLKSCSEEALLTGKCQVIVIHEDESTKISFDGNRVCVGDRCSEISGNFERRVEYGFFRVILITRLDSGDLRVEQKPFGEIAEVDE